MPHLSKGALAVAICAVIAAACAQDDPSQLTGYASPSRKGNGGQTVDDGSGAADNGGGNSAGNGGGASGNGGGASGNGGADAGSAPQAALASGLTISEIAFFQGVKVSVAKGGQSVTARSAPVVAGRDALVRVYVTPDASWTPRPITAELTLVDGTSALPIVSDTKTLQGASSDADLSSTFDLQVPGGSLPSGVKYSVALRDPSGAGGGAASGGAQFPAGGAPVALGAESSGAQLKVVVVPVLYGADGSNRAPDVSQAQLDRFKSTMYAYYPAAKVDVSVRAQPVQYDQAIAADGTGWSDVLTAMINARQQDGVASDVYYFGVFEPSSSFDGYCASGCVVGLSGLADDPMDPTVRASVGIGYTGDEAALTMAHEVGHAHGRAHAPCGGAAGPDPSFPYADGGIGSWGYDVVKKQLFAPSQGKDLMGYCTPAWISDYTYAALFARMKLVNGASMLAQRFDAPIAYRVVNVAADGALSFGRQVTLGAAPTSRPSQVTYHDATGAIVASATAHYYPYSDLPGGFYLVPEGGATWSALTISGLTKISRTF